MVMFCTPYLCINVLLPQEKDRDLNLENLGTTKKFEIEKVAENILVKL